MEILVTIGYIALCVFLFSLAIAIHEFGHFIVALKLGLNVERFSIGFGPAIWKRKIGRVEYRVSWILLGGYVSIPDVDPEGTKALEGGGATKRLEIPVWKEIAVAFAGPAMNIVLAVLLAVGLSLWPGARFGELAAEIGSVIEGGPADRAGMKPGDVVVSVGGKAVRTWTDMMVEVQISGGKPTPFVIERKTDGGAASSLTLTIAPERDGMTGAYLIKTFSVTNETGAAMWMPGRSPLKQLAWDAGSIFRILKGLVTPKEARATAGALGGPVMIAENIYRSVRRDFADGLGFLRYLNVNLAVLNLLPIPVLDGGLILFALIAVVFRRRVPEKTSATISTCFMYLLIGLMAVLVFKDSVRTWRIHTWKGDVHEETDQSAEDR